MNVYNVCYREVNELVTEIEAESGEEALSIFESLMMSGSVDFGDMETVDSEVFVDYDDVTEDKERTFDDVLDTYERYLDEHYDLDLGRESFIMPDEILCRIVTNHTKSIDEKFELINGLLIDNFIGDVILDSAIDDSDLTDKDKEILNENWDEFQSWAFDLDVTVNEDELNAYIAKFVLQLMS